MIKNNYFKKGFTLIELLIVIVILGILVVTVAPRFTRGPELARDGLRKTDLNNVASAIDQYLGIETTNALTAGCFGTGLVDLVTDTYISGLPIDPAAATAALTNYCATAGQYAYLPLAQGGYALIARMQRGTLTDPGVTCLPATPWTATTTVQTVTTQIQTDVSCGTTDLVYIVAH